MTLKTDDLDLGQKVKILNFLLWNDESKGGKFFYVWKVVWKLKEDGEKRYNQEKKLHFFCLVALALTMFPKLTDDYFYLFQHWFPSKSSWLRCERICQDLWYWRCIKGQFIVLRLYFDADLLLTTSKYFIWMLLKTYELKLKL